MKRWIIRLAVVFICAAFGGAAVWCWMSQASKQMPMENIPRLQTQSEALSKPTNNQNDEAVFALPEKRKSPVYGRKIMGLPEFCADKLISVSGCDGQTEITTEQGNTYRLVEIGDQCWFADNAKEIPTVSRQRQWDYVA